MFRFRIQSKKNKDVGKSKANKKRVKDVKPEKKRKHRR